MDDRRRNERFSVELAAEIAGDGCEKQQKCKITELSLDGVRLLLNEKISFGRKITLCIQIPGQCDPVIVPLTVRWNKRLYDGQGFDYLAGGELGQVEPSMGKILFDCMHKNGTLSS